MDRHITSYEFEAHKREVRQDIHGLDQNLDTVRNEVKALEKSIQDLKFSLVKTALTGILSFISGGSIITAILKAIGKL